ncbi:MAG TPA: hypothetical protein DIC18_03605 [Clostridiales bacterium]|nr:hypothetical protein [Clostridiales bacterium]
MPHLLKTRVAFTAHQPAERGEGTKTNALQGANQPAIAPPEPLEAYRYEARQEDANERTLVRDFASSQTVNEVDGRL